MMGGTPGLLPMFNSRPRKKLGLEVSPDSRRALPPLSSCRAGGVWFVACCYPVALGDV